MKLFAMVELKCIQKRATGGMINLMTIFMNVQQMMHVQGLLVTRTKRYSTVENAKVAILEICVTNVLRAITNS